MAFALFIKIADFDADKGYMVSFVAVTDFTNRPPIQFEQAQMRPTLGGRQLTSDFLNVSAQPSRKPYVNHELAVVPPTAQNISVFQRNVAY